MFETISGDSGSVTATSPTQTVSFVGGTNITTSISGNVVTITNTAPGANDELVKVSATDTTAGFLGAKLVGGTSISLTTLNPAGNEQISIDLDEKSFFNHNGIITQTLNTNFSIVLFNTSVRTNGIYSYSSGAVTVNQDGWYAIQFDTSAIGTSNSRRTAEWRLQVNAVDVAGSYAYSYHRSSTSGNTTASSVVQIQLTSGDILRVRGRSASGTITTIANGCRLNITTAD